MQRAAFTRRSCRPAPPIMTSLPASSSRWNGASAPPAKARSSSFWARPGYPATPPGWIIATARPIGITRRPRKSTPASPRIASPSPARKADRLGAHARDLGVVLVIGVNERVERGPGNGSLYNSSLTYDATGQLVNHHRKLMPTYTERLIWGQGDGAGLRAVDTAAGRLSSLVCWEHWMPLARQAPARQWRADPRRPLANGEGNAPGCQPDNTPLKGVVSCWPRAASAGGGHAARADPARRARRRAANARLARRLGDHRARRRLSAGPLWDEEGICTPSWTCAPSPASRWRSTSAATTRGRMSFAFGCAANDRAETAAR